MVMKVINKIFLALIFFFSLQVNAEEVWKPFGIELGQPLPENIKFINEHVPWGNSIEPPINNDLFEWVSVETVKDNKLVETIHARAKFKYTKDCRNAANDIITIAKNKKFNERSSYDKNEWYSWGAEKEKYSISVVCDYKYPTKYLHINWSIYIPTIDLTGID
jgi:hypothetical protein